MYVLRPAMIVIMALLAGCVTTPPEEDPVIQRLTELDGRLLRIERILSNQSLLEQSQRIDTAINDVRALRGQIDQLQHAQEAMRAQQRELYADLDKRLQAIESRSVSAPTAVVQGQDTTDDTAAYKRAFDLLKEGKYAESATAFNQMIAAHPQSPLLDNAYYWLGEAHYVAKDYPTALRSFKTVVEKFPDSRKLADAWLKIGYCHYELKNWRDAREALRRVQQVAAGTATAKLAEQRLAKIQAEGH